MEGEFSEQEKIRRDKLAALSEKGFGYPNDVRITGTQEAFLAQEIATPPESGREWTVAGRLVQFRLMGKAAFVHVLDGSVRLQWYVKRDEVGEEAFEAFKLFDIGDIVEGKGYLFTTKTGEKSLHAKSIRLLVKGLVPLPEKWHGLADVETRYRQRYVDLIANPDVRNTFRVRAKIIKEIRAYLDERGFLEVDTPILQYVAGGATAKPFKTFYNALGTGMSLRIAVELYLKQLVVGGFERVYEIGRNFRNEGLSKKHNPEFTMLEFYQAYATFEDLMTMTEDLYCKLVKSLTGGSKITYGEHEIDFTPPWPRLSMEQSVHTIGGVDKTFALSTIEGVKKAATQYGVHLDEPEDWGRSLEALWGKLVEPKLINPTFITYHPFSISPLARKCSSDPKVTDRFELIIAGMESANAFSELNDPLDQRARFEAQAVRRAKGDEEATEVDTNFVRALEYGLPPTAGEGIGIDRLVMLLTNSPTIRDVLLFPQLKPESAEEAQSQEAKEG